MSAEGGDDAGHARWVDALSADHARAARSDAERALLDYAVKLTSSPSAVSAADVEALRRVGFDDRGIHDICCIAAYFGFVNRVADGLGVELEPRWGRGGTGGLGR